MSHKNKLAICTNCSTELKNQENFCPNCGQENHDLKIPIGHLIYEAIESVFHFDNKFGNTAKLLLFRPGVVSREFNEGKRARFVPPFRLYIFISFVFFFLLSIFLHPEEGKLMETIELNNQEYRKDYNEEENFILEFSKKELEQVKNWTDKQVDSALIRKGHKTSAVNRFMVKRGEKLSKLTKAEFVHKAIKNISILMFLLMPLFALFLSIFYYRKKNYYFQHLIFSIHFHSFLFLISSVVILFNFYFSFNIFWPVFLIVIFYLALALKNFFKQGWGKTIAKLILLTLTYSFTILIFSLLTILISIFY